MFSRFGAAESIHSDQGRSFESRVFATMCERLGMHKTRTTPLHPQSDGLVERFNKTLGQQLVIVSAKHQRDWDKHLPMVLMACRSAVQDSTSCTPALLMLGREIRTPVEMAFGLPLDSPHVPPGPESARRLQDRLETAHTFAREQLVNAGVRQKRERWHCTGTGPQTPGTPTIPHSGNDILQAPTPRCRRQGSRQPTPPVSLPVSLRGSPEPWTVFPVSTSLSPISLPSSPGSQRGSPLPRMEPRVSHLDTP
nr:uncharacterized protein LOC112069894 [Salvelinus alpinus]